MTSFLGNSWTLMLFFRYCMRYKVEKISDRQKVLERIARKGKVTRIKDIGPLLQGRKVLHTTHKRNDNAN